MSPRVYPAVDPLPLSTDTYRDGRGRTRRLALVAIPKKKPDLDRFC